MSYIKKIEEEYNNGIISLDKLSEQREFYKKLSQDEKDELNEKFGSKSNEQSETLTEVKQDDIQNETLATNYYYLWLLSCGVFGLIFFAQQGARGNFSDIVILDFFFSFLSMGFIPMIFISLICLPIKIFSKISTGKLLFWTSIILGMANVLNGTFS